MVAKLVIGILAIYLVVWDILLTLISLNNSTAFGIVCMAWGLAVVWIIFGGSVMYLSRDKVREVIQSIPLPWQVTFVLFATLLALLEEAVTVTLTNMAPLFGSKVGEAYITASANYFDVVLFHSVVVFIPLFIAWAILLTRYAFKPFAVFILFGLFGILAEISFGGPQQILGFAQWIFVYGLMVYLPAYCLPQNHTAKKPGFFAHLFALPITLVIALPLLIPIVYIISSVLGHPSMHFG